MKLNPEFIVYNEDGDTLLVPTAKAPFSGVLRGNKTVGAILEMLQEEITQEEIVTRLRERFEAEDGVIEKDVESTLADLRSIGAIDE